jgi:class 3 adenylate cyclase
MVLDIDTVLEHAGLEAPALFALSDGVPIALAFAATRPERLSRMVLVDGWSQPSDFVRSPTWQVEEAIREQDWTLYTETMARVLVGLEGDAARRYAEYMRSCIDRDALRSIYAAFDGWDVSGMLSRVSVPTLVVHNRSHPFQAAEAGRRLAVGIPGARLLEVDEPLAAARGHLPQLIREFMQVAEPEPGAGAPATEPPIDAASDVVRTILFTDMESSTALTQRLGDARAQELVRAHNAIVREALAAHGGAEIKHTGDGIMASFPSASRALECAVAIQRAVEARNKEQGAGNKEDELRMRIGLNAGEPVAEEQDLFGTAVQLARRICDKAEGGEILASDVVRQLTAGKGFLFSDRGEAALRGIAEPVRLFAVRWRE